MPPRIDSRIAIRWLIRCTLLVLITIAVSSTLFSQFSDTSLHAPEANGRGEWGGQKEENKKIANTMVVASLKKDDNSWLEDEGIQRNLEAWEKKIYVVNAEDGGEGDLRVPQNKGREAMVYLTYIIDNYDRLPNLTIFLHSQRYQWHNDDPIYDGVPILQNLKLDYLYAEGYANLRCGWTLGCPAEMRPNKEQFDDGDKESEANYHAAFLELFPGIPVPDVIGVGCCAQFAVSASTIRSRPLADYVHYRTWLLETPLPDRTSGRIMEYSWHMIFGRQPVHCPPAGECYCKTFGYCNLTCTEDACPGRYTLPPYSDLPKGWPEKGWD